MEEELDDELLDDELLDDEPLIEEQVILPILFPPFSANQRLPSGPEVIPKVPLLADGENSLIVTELHCIAPLELEEELLEELEEDELLELEDDEEELLVAVIVTN